MLHIKKKLSAALGILLGTMLMLSGCSTLFDIKDGDGMINTDAATEDALAESTDDNTEDTASIR